MKTTQAERDELRRLEQAATGGPWQANGPEVYRNVGELPYDIADVLTDFDSVVENSQLIAAARNSLAGLLDDVETLREALSSAIARIEAYEDIYMNEDLHAALAEPKPAK